ncbi:MAG: hypothetical protein U0401_23510 [Anaerolineae bacterium]
MEPLVKPSRIIKRIVPLMPPPVTRFIVPFVDVTFNRASIEVQRGCTGVRAPKAGMIFRPVRERSLAELVKRWIKLWACYEEIGLLSLSSSDYTQIGSLVKTIANKYSDKAPQYLAAQPTHRSFSADLLEYWKAAARPASPLPRKRPPTACVMLSTNTSAPRICCKLPRILA